MKYNKEELSKLAKGVFKDDKTSPSVYANEEGTFLNSDQYEERKKAGTHKSFVFEFKNPNVKPAPVADESAKDAEIAELKRSIADRDEALVDAHDHIKAQDARIDSLEHEISDIKQAALMATPALAPEPSKKKSTKTAKA